MNKEYTTKEIYNLVEECGANKQFMNKVWIPKENIKTSATKRKEEK